MKILVTGAAGFIGFSTAKQLLERGDTVVGLDNFNDYYDVKLKESRAKILEAFPNFHMVRCDLEDRSSVEALFALQKFNKVVHMAAQAGVRYSIENPHAYISSNIVGTLHILEGCRHNDVQHLVYASSSSVYGSNTSMPFSIHQNVDHPLALYGATKKANELMAHSYSSLYDLPTTGLRFFTVYGPWGRPDMALFLFTKNIIEGKPIDVFNYGKHRRDFTYIDDIVNGFVAALDRNHGLEIFNLGCGNTVELMDFVETIEKACGKKGVREMLPMQLGDVVQTYADIGRARELLGFEPKTTTDVGLPRFVEWYRKYYSV